MASPSSFYHPRTFASHINTITLTSETLRNAANRLQHIHTTAQALTALQHPTHAMHLFFHLAAGLRDSRTRAEAEELLLQLQRGNAGRQATGTLRDAVALLRLVRQIHHPNHGQMQPYC